MASMIYTALKADWDRATEARKAADKVVDSKKDYVLDAVHGLRDAQGKWNEATFVQKVVEAFDALEAAEETAAEASRVEDEAYMLWQANLD